VSATSVRLLSALAARLVVVPAYRRDEFFTALVARAELRLNLAPRGAVPVAASLHRPGPADYLPTFVLWNLDARREAQGLRPDLSFRRLAFDLLDTALALEPAAVRRPAVEAALLRTLGRPQTLSDWLVSGLGSAGWRVETNWRRDLTARLAAEALPGLAGLDGLTLACANSPVQLVAGGGQRDLALDVNMIAPLWFADLLPSPDGRYLASLHLSVDSRSQAVLLDLATSEVTPVTAADAGTLILGWSAGGYLYYLVPPPAFDDSRSYELHRFSPATRQAELAWPDRVLPPVTGRFSIWSADRTRLAIAAISSPGTPAAVSYPVVLTADAPMQAPLAERAIAFRGAGVAPVLSPDGTRLAVFTTTNTGAVGALASLPGIRDQVELIDVATGERELYLTVNDLHTGPDSRYFAFGGLAWSPDGRWLTLYGYREGAGPHLYLVPAIVAPGTRPRPQRLHTGQTDVLGLVGFSADGRYLAVMDWAAFNDLSQVVVFDLQSPSAAAAPMAFTANSASWSPNGHILAVAGPLGVYALEPFAPAYQWVRSSSECELGWGE
jgi:hypothetical protein